MFTGQYGTPVEPRTFNRAFTARCRKAGVRTITVHDARRTCATLLVDLDVHPRIVMQILRHAQFAVTMEIYAEGIALRRLGDSLSGPRTHDGDDGAAGHERRCQPERWENRAQPPRCCTLLLQRAENDVRGPFRITGRGLWPGRGGGIRTHGLFVPNEARYQAAPHPGGASSG